MINAITSTLNRINTKKTYKILCMPTHEGYQTLMGKTGHEFYMIGGINPQNRQPFKGWDFHTRPLPENHYLYLRDFTQIYSDVTFDLILSQNRLDQFPILQDVSRKLNIPLIQLEHTQPPPGMNDKSLRQLVKERRADIHVYITDFNKQAWYAEPKDFVIRHGIDTETFKGWNGNNPSGLSIVNYFPQRDAFCGWKLWSEITKDIPIELVGENPNLSKSINSVPELVSKIASSRFYLNTSQWSPVPLSMLEAMAVGCPVVTTAKQEIPSIITNGVNGLMSDDPEELKKYCKQLIEDKEMAKQIGEAGRQTILTAFSIGRFSQQWQSVFDAAFNKGRFGYGS